MASWPWYAWLYIVGVAGMTLIALVTDLKARRIPNWLTVPMFFAGWIYQAAFFGGAGLLDALAGFALGFGMLFALWLMAGGGAGDAKLMEALSVWLGFMPTVAVIVVSTAFIAVFHVGTILYRFFTRGYRAVRKDIERDRKDREAGKEVAARGRLILPYAVPLGLATWLVIGWEASLAKHAPFKPVKPAVAQAPLNTQRS